MAAATRRTFSKVKSSAIRPRQPSVPNLIWVMSFVVGRWSFATGGELHSPDFVIPSEARDLHFAADCRSLASLGMTTHKKRPPTAFSHQLMQLLLIQMLHHFAD